VSATVSAAVTVSATARIVHCKRAPYDIYIGRPSKYGNPFVIGRDGTRAQVIAKYRAWILTQPALLASLHELDGKVLGCWCAPQACHGDVLVELRNRQLDELRGKQLDRTLEIRRKITRG
jgi:hypothetical protein